jgi:hypothetical protein
MDAVHHKRTRVLTSKELMLLIADYADLLADAWGVDRNFPGLAAVIDEI